MKSTGVHASNNEYHMVTRANQQLHRQSSQNPKAFNDTTGSHADQNTSILTKQLFNPVNKSALAIEKQEKKTLFQKQSLFHRKNTQTFNGKNEKNKKFKNFGDVFHKTFRRQPNVTEDMKVNHFHAYLRGLGLKTVKNMQRTLNRTLED